MGQAQTAAVDDVMSLYWNPAGLGLLGQNEVGFMRNNFFQGVTHDVLYYAHPTYSRGTFGAGLSSLRVGGIAGFDGSGAKTGDVSASDTLLTLGWGRPWKDIHGLNAGLNVKLLKKNLAGDSATAYMADMGGLYQFQGGWFEGLRTGLVVQNLGSGPTFIQEKSKLPLSIKFGTAYPLFGDNMTLALDAVFPSDGGLSLNAGIDYRLWDILAFRIGHGGKNDLDTSLTYGFGIGNRRLHLDYAFTPFGALGDGHRVSVGFRFGSAYRQDLVRDQINEAYGRAAAQYAQGFLVQSHIDAQRILDVAPWHRPSQTLLKRVESEFKELKVAAHREEMQGQINEHFSRGEKHFQADQLIVAKREFEAVLALEPDYVGARTYLKRIDERFRSVIQHFYETAMRAFAGGDYQQAKNYLEKVLVVDSENAGAREQLSRTNRLLGAAEKAAGEQARLEVVGPIYQSALNLFEQKEYEKALYKFEEVLRLDVENNEARRYGLLSRDLVAKKFYKDGNTAAQNGNWVEADDLFRKALKYKPLYPEAKEALSRVGLHLDERNKGESQKLYRLGLEAFLSDDQDKAAEYWGKAVDIDDKNLEAKRGLERIMQKRGVGQ
jgi:tetratricopeptide (TPR) repeat protein